MRTANPTMWNTGTARHLRSAWCGLAALALALLGSYPVFGQEVVPPGAIVLDPHMDWREGDGVKPRTSSFRLERPEEGLRIEVLEPGHGTVLNSSVSLRLDPQQTPILAFTYRATGLDLTNPNAPVLVFWGGKPSSFTVVTSSDLRDDDQEHEVLIDLGERLAEAGAGAEALAWIDLRVRAAAGPAVFTLLDLRFEPDGEVVISPEAQQEASPVTVRVTDAGGKPVPDAEVTLDPHTKNLRATAKTDAEGRATVKPVMPGLAGTRRCLQVTKEGMTRASFRDLKDVTEDTELHAELYPIQTLSGRVVDEDGKPVPHAVGELWLQNLPRVPSPGSPSSYWGERVVADTEGRWSHAAVPRYDSLTVQVRWTTAGYVQDQWGGQYSGQLSMADLQSGKAVSTLKRGIELTGMVLDEAGNPIAGANVAQGEDRFPSNAPPATTTDPAGIYHFAGVPPGTLVLTITAKGYAPELVKTQAAKGMAAVNVVLPPPHTFRFRVVDPAGNPLPGISFSADTWRGLRTIPQRFSTNAEGRATWQGPNDPVKFDIFARDRMRQEVTTGPSAGENDITEVVMSGPLTVTIRATDAETGEPVPQFQVITGILWQTDGQQPSWQRNQRDKPGRNGQWQETFTHNYPFLVFRIEADGYTPAVSDRVSKDAGTVELAFALKKGTPLAGTVVDPYGKPVSDATVCLAIGNNMLLVRNGRLENNLSQATSQTKADGGFSFPPQADDFVLVVIGEKGYAEVDQNELSANKGNVVLQPWATVTGRLLVGNTPRANETVSAWQERQHKPGMPQPYHDLKGTTDADGNYRIDRVPPGKVGIGRDIRLRENMTGRTLTQKITVEPGQTTVVNLGGTGRPVVGRFVWPEGAKVQSLQVGHYSLATEVRKAMVEVSQRFIPEGFQTWDAERRKAWLRTDEAKELRAKMDAATQEIYGRQRRYSFAIEADGSFRVDNVEPGTYELTLQAHAPPASRNHGYGEQIASLSTEVIVPPFPEGTTYLDTPLDLGALTVMPMKPAPQVGEVAPDFALPLLDLAAADPEAAIKDAKPLSLRELRGKFVLVDFWATWCGPCVGETPFLKKVWEAHGTNERFAMIGISLDGSAKAPADYAKGNQLAWPQAYLGDAWKGEVTTSYAIRSIPSIWLIGPDGKIVAKDLRGEGIGTAVAAALARGAK